MHEIVNAGSLSGAIRTPLTHETLRTTPAMALGLTDQPWSIGDLLDAALAVAPADPTTTAPQRRRRFRVIEGGRS